jgi:hypothetical protein
MQKVRIPDKELEIIKQVFRKHFSPLDELWIFGSRTDMTRKGGDIDFYVETREQDVGKVADRKSAFVVELWDRIGEQKIDVVLNLVTKDFHLPIYDVARQTGAQIIMNILAENIKIAQIHAEKIEVTLAKITSYFPITAKMVEEMPIEQIMYVEFFTNRFAKLQDLIGNKIFTNVLEVAEGKEVADKMTFFDKLNKLERLEAIESVETWKALREARNHLAHEYPDEPEMTAKYLNEIYAMAPKLLEVLTRIIKFAETHKLLS